MILDKLKNHKRYDGMHPSFKKAFNYLISTDFSKVEVGKYFIDGENIFALVQEFTPKKEKDCKLEGHEKHIDIQYVYLGEEFMGHQLLYEQIPLGGKYVNDLAFFNDSCVNIKVKKDEFIIFFPEDLHKPCIQTRNCDFVKKIVIKISCRNKKL